MGNQGGFFVGWDFELFLENTDTSNMTLDESFRMKHCRFCLNNKFDPDFGTICSLKKIPKVSKEGCSEFRIDKKNVLETYKLHNNTKNHERKEVKKDIRNTLLWLVPTIVVGLVSLYKSYSLDQNYRYTIAKVTLIKQSGWTERFLWFGGISKELEYKYRLNNKYYRVKTEFKNETTPGLPSKYLVKYDPEDPNLSEIVRNQNVEYFPLKEHPQHGISADSLEYFLSIYKAQEK